MERAKAEFDQVWGEYDQINDKFRQDSDVLMRRINPVTTMNANMKSSL